ncbi:MAG: hypothetical protein OSJ73_10095 [Lachnospiraceae bacterium]|nr:hypothetical protein [Lachnospiraceae bacterium]HBV82268.1 hypothetical protein [Lachnospiraceae bacterium]
MKNRIAIIAIVTAFMMTGCQSNAGNSEETEALKEQIAHLEQQVTDLERLLASGTMYATETNDVQGQLDAVSDNNEQAVPDVNTNENVQSQGNNNTPNNTQFPSDADNNQQSQNNTNVGNSQQLQNDTNVGNNQQPQNNTNVGNGHIPGHDEGTYHNSVNSDISGAASSDQQSVSADIKTTNTMADLSSLVEAFVTKANAAVPSGTVSQDMEQFFAFKQEEKQIDDLLDQHEDELEYLYKKQSLTRDEYKRLERELDLLDDKLDAAKDQLEFVFGIDD